MPQLLRSAGALKCDEASADGLITLKCKRNDWRNSALLDTRGSCGFVMTVHVVRGAAVLAGIAPADADITQDGIHGHCIYTKTLTWYAEGIRCRRVGLPFRPLVPGEQLYLRYFTEPRPEFAVSVTGKNFTVVPATHEYTNFVPYVSLRNSDVTVQILHLVASEQSAIEGRRRTMQDRLWQDRLFTDCTVTCGSTAFQCHRAILANASAVWRTALESTFREGRDAKLGMDDADPGVVEAVLKYAYTCEFECGDIAAALVLAHRYEMPKLVALCAIRLLDDVTAENVAHIAATLNAYMEHEEVAKVWPQLLDIIGQDQELMDAAMRSVKTARSMRIVKKARRA